MIKLTPTGARLLVRRDEVKERSAGGIIFADTKQHMRNTAEVLVVGPEVTLVSPGDRILHKEYTGVPIRYAGLDDLLIEEQDVMAILDDSEA